MAIEHTIWPLTIVADRYNGMYAGGLYIALHCKPD